MLTQQLLSFLSILLKLDFLNENSTLIDFPNITVYKSSGSSIQSPSNKGHEIKGDINEPPD
jgi:hypothetical protein